MLANTKTGEIFRRVFNTDLYQIAQSLLKERERETKKRCDGIEQSILQYISGISTSESEIGQKLTDRISNASIHTAEDILVGLRELISEDTSSRNDLKRKSDELEQKLAGQIARITEGQYINQFFQDLRVAEQREKALAANREKHSKEKEELEMAEKALYTILP